MARHTTSLRRFESADIDPAQAVGLRPDHPALSGRRTIFPTTVVPSKASPRFLVSGHNSSKIGKEITKGARTGWPIFTLTLEERATCPSSCEQWAGCYGNAMPFARRHTPDADFIPLLKAEVATVARQHPDGLLIRLHVLGDFFSVEYVLAWAELLMEFPQVHAFGYTARTVLDFDPESRRIARALALLTDYQWDRFAIRTSTSFTDVADSRSIVVDEDPGHPDVIVCPAQTKATEVCGSCGLCWSPNARDKTIAFLRHGMTRTRGPRQPKPVEVRQVPSKHAEPLRTGRGGLLPTSMPEGSPQEPGFSAYQTASMQKVMDALTRKAKGGKVTISFSVLSTEAGVPNGSISFLLDSLVKRGLIETTKGVDRRPNTYTLLSPAGKTAPKHVDPMPAPAPVALPALAKLPLAEVVNLATPAPRPVARARIEEPREVRAPRVMADIDLSDIADALGPPTTGLKRLTALRPGECRWPEGVPDANGQLYCGKPCGHLTYCSKHGALMFASRKPSGKGART